jgi:hypothetical protein
VSEERTPEPIDFISAGVRVGMIIDASTMPELWETASGVVWTGAAPAQRLRVTAVSKHSISVEVVPP